MGTVHELLEAKGRRGALEAGIERPIVEVAATYLSDEDAGLGFAKFEVAEAGVGAVCPRFGRTPRELDNGYGYGGLFREGRPFPYSRLLT